MGGNPAKLIAHVYDTSIKGKTHINILYTFSILCDPTVEQFGNYPSLRKQVKTKTNGVIVFLV